MSETSEEKRVLSPKLCAYPREDEPKGYHIEITLPGVEKDTIKLKMHDDSFFIKGESDDVVYVGSYTIANPVKAGEAKAKYKNGLLMVDVPFKSPLEDAIDISIE
jgi:HSP20 family molecular chaperone IbpA